ncbi:MAG: hypothetical protein KatS3mg088_486 [Patescibacteria group bacterium]|nr:MAG: hypothetical protein KatS3mg088_486 [Patescibacteria group bacterium]
MKKIAIITIIAIVIIRFFSINLIPPGISDDEVEYAISAESYSLYNRDISGSRFPISLFESQTYGKISAIPPILTSVPLKIIKFNVTNLRILYMFVNLITAFFVYILTLRLTNSKKTALLGSILFLVNPWSIYLSTYIGDSPFALLFYLSFIATLLIFNGWKLIIPFLILIMAFFSYHGGKIILLPILLITLLFKKKVDKKIKPKEFIIITILTTIFLLTYLIISLNLPNSDINARSKEISLFTPEIISSVNKNRTQIIQNPLTNIFINKYTESFRQKTKQYLSAFSPEVIFISGDTRALYRFEYHGLFYLIDIILISIGLLEMYKKKIYSFLFLISLAVIAPIPTAISKIEISVINRSFLLLPVIIIFSAYGFTFLVNIVPKKIKKLVIPILICLYITSITYFYHFYLFRMPITGQEKYWLSENVICKYLEYKDINKEVKIITPNPRSALLRFLILSKNKDIKDAIKNPLPYIEENKEYQLGSITFTKLCPETISKNTIYIKSSRLACDIPFKPTFTIIDQKDAGVIINIYNSDICQGISKDVYRRFHYLKYYDLENLSYEDFCSNWINIPL